MSFASKPVVASFEVNVNATVAALEEPPLLRPVAVIVMVGPVVSYVHANVLETVLPLPGASVNVPARTLIVDAPSVVGVNVAV